MRQEAIELLCAKEVKTVEKQVVDLAAGETGDGVTGTIRRCLGWLADRPDFYTGCHFDEKKRYLTNIEFYPRVQLYIRNCKYETLVRPGVTKGIVCPPWWWLISL